MKHFFFLTALVFSSVSVAAIQVAMTLKVDGKTTDSTVIIQPGLGATITQDDMQIHVRSYQPDSKAGDLSFKIFQMGKGEPVLLASPWVRTAWGTPAEVTQQAEGGKKISLRVTPTLVP